MSTLSIPSTMLEAVVDKTTTVSLRTVLIPRPGPSELLIKVVVCGSNPKDWKRPQWQDKADNTGDDLAGTVALAGSSVAYLYPPGTRVAACHALGAPHGSFAEYAIAPAATTFALPPHISFEQAATIPLAALTAAAGLFLRMGLPMPWGLPPGVPHQTADEAAIELYGPTASDAGRKASEQTPREPVLVYGAASAVGAYAIQLAKRAHLGPVIAVAGRGIPFVRGLLDESGGDVIIDYREGDDAVVAALQKALADMGRGSRDLKVAFDAVTDKGSYTNIGNVLADDGSAKMAVVLPAAMQPNGKFEGVGDDVQVGETWVFQVAELYPIFGATFSKIFEVGLREGWLKPHPHEVVPGGLREGVQQGLRNLRDGKASAVKYVVRIEDTPELATK